MHLRNGQRRVFTAGILALILGSAIWAGCAALSPSSEDVLRAGAQTDETGPVAFRYLPKSKQGDIDWVVALRSGAVKPRDGLTPDATPGNPLDLNIIFRTGNAYPIPDVVFPHLPHTQWLECNNCHPALFRMKQGSNPISMAAIVKGEFCGRCHGTVAFPIVDCFRCHSRPKGR